MVQIELFDGFATLVGQGYHVALSIKLKLFLASWICRQDGNSIVLPIGCAKKILSSDLSPIATHFESRDNVEVIHVIA
jgi:hypothetical protein